VRETGGRFDLPTEPLAEVVLIVAAFWLTDLALAASIPEEFFVDTGIVEWFLA